MRQNETVYSAIFQELPFIMVVVGANNEPIYEGPLFRSLEDNFIFFHSNEDVKIAATKKILLEEAKKTFKDRRSRFFELSDPDNNRWCRCVVSFLQDPNFVMISHIDISEMKRLEISLQQKQALLVDARLGTWELDTHTNKLNWSEELFRIHGREPALGTPTLDEAKKTIHPADLETVEKDMQKVVEGKQSLGHSIKIVRPDGSIRYLRTWMRPIADEFGSIVGIMGLSQDITDQKLIEQNLLETSSLLKATIESTADGILVVSRDQEAVITYNQKFIDMWGVPRGLLESHDNLLAFNYALDQLKDPESFRADVDALLANPAIESFNTLEFSDGRVFERYSKPQKLGTRIVGRVWSFRDVTARVHAEREALAANAAKTQFLANMSHEIRTPLTAVLGFSDVMASFDLNPSERQDLAGKIQNQGSQLLRIVDDILDLSKFEFGHLKVRESKVDIASLLEDVRGTFAFQLSEKKIELRFFMKGKIPSVIYSDLVRLKQILVNLVGNAVKFTSKGFIDITVEFLRNDQRNPQLSFRVRDTGIGMDARQSDFLFKPFTQLDASMTRKYGGTGLGLALARNLATALGGTVKFIEASPGKGSTFEAIVNTGDITFSNFISEFPTPEGLQVPTPHSPEKATASSPLSGARILLAEDSPDNQILTFRFLKAAGAERIDAAANGKEAVSMAINGNYDLVLMDLQMPVMDGYAATAELRKKGYKKPIVALTAHAMPEEVERCLQVGCDFHISKPIDRKLLIETAAKFTHLAQRTTLSEVATRM